MNWIYCAFQGLTWCGCEHCFSFYPVIWLKQINFKIITSNNWIVFAVVFKEILNKHICIWLLLKWINCIMKATTRLKFTNNVSEMWQLIVTWWPDYFCDGLMWGHSLPNKNYFKPYYSSLFAVKLINRRHNRTIC